MTISEQIEYLYLTKVILKEDINNKEMLEFFTNRTNRHINLVKKYCKKVANYNPSKFKELILRGEKHDASKFKDPEKEPYVYVTWQYKCKDDGKEFNVPQNIKDNMNKATEHHVKTNSHHPEFHSLKQIELINRENRDKPPREIVDATKMPDIDIGEMVADWCAMSEEKGTSPIDWAKKNIDIRWKFTTEQKNLILELIHGIWNNENL
jgi:hypothetical protein